MEIDRDFHCSMLIIRHTLYIDYVVSLFYQQDSKAVDNPCESGMNLSKMQPPTTNNYKNEMKSKQYGSFVWCFCTSDLYKSWYLICGHAAVADFGEVWTETYEAATCVLRYLKTTKDDGITYDGSASELQTKAYTDAYW